MSKNKQGVYSQSSQSKHSFNFRKPVKDKFEDIKQTLELMSGETLTKTQVIEWIIEATDHQLKREQERAIRYFRSLT